MRFCQTEVKPETVCRFVDLSKADEAMNDNNKLVKCVAPGNKTVLAQR